MNEAMKQVIKESLVKTVGPIIGDAYQYGIVAGMIGAILCQAELAKKHCRDIGAPEVADEIEAAMKILMATHNNVRECSKRKMTESIDKAKLDKSSLN